MSVCYNLPGRAVLLPVAVILFGCWTPVGYAADAAAQPEDKLIAEDRQLLEGLIQDFLFDPKGAKRVRVKTTVRTVWARSTQIERDGWLVAGKPDGPARVYFLDKEFSVPAPKGPIEEIDFVATAKSRLAERQKEEEAGGGLDRGRFRQMRRNAIGQTGLPDLAHAAWLHRLGHNDLAARALHEARAAAKGDERKMVAQLRKDLAWSAFAAMVHAYMVRADEEALAAGKRLLSLYPDEAKAYPQAATIVEELRRRKKEGTFGKPPRPLYPPGSDEWATGKKVAHLIDRLEDVEARQRSQPGFVTLAMDMRVAALIDIGDEAVPALIDAIEKDRRLTRSVHFWRDFGRSRTVLGVREAALEALMTILRTQAFEVRSTGDDFTSRGDAAAKAFAERLRAYWKKYGHLPFDERMMAILTDPEASFRATREAAYNLAHLGEARLLDTSGARITFGGQQRRKSANPAVAKFKDPTVAKAILAAMDRDLKNLDVKPRDDLYDYSRRQIEEQYLRPLIYLGDQRIAGELMKRYRSAKTIRQRRNWANAAHHLGNQEAMKEFARDVEEGALKLPANEPDTHPSDQPGNVELGGIVRDLAHAGTPEADRALNALADPKHAYYLLARQRVLKEHPGWSDEESWFAHPYCLKILWRELDNEKLTGGKYRIEGDTLHHEFDGGSSSGSIPSLLADPQSRRTEAQERACDRAAEKLLQLTFGLPGYHPLQKNAEANLDMLKKTFDGYRQGFRRATALEAEFLDLFPRDVTYIPNILPLERPATAKDVKEGRAVFHLDGKGRVSKQKLPAVARLKTAGETGGHATSAHRVLVVQAEIGPNGSVIYGIVGDGPARMVKGADLTDVKPIKKSFWPLNLFQ